MKHLPSSSRRRVLEVIATAAAGAAAVHLTGCSSGASPAPVGDVSAGNIADLPEGTLRAVGGEAVAIGRDARGIYAMTLTCTHAGCNIGSRGSVSASGLSCGCHGARFDANGDPTGGPASDPLVHYAVEVASDGTITIHGGTEVDPATRTAVPA